MRPGQPRFISDIHHPIPKSAHLPRLPSGSKVDLDFSSVIGRRIFGSGRRRHFGAAGHAADAVGVPSPHLDLTVGHDGRHRRLLVEKRRPGARASCMSAEVDDVLLGRTPLQAALGLEVARNPASARGERYTGP